MKSRAATDLPLTNGEPVCSSGTLSSSATSLQAGFDLSTTEAVEKQAQAGACEAARLSCHPHAHNGVSNLRMRRAVGVHLKHGILSPSLPVPGLISICNLCQGMVLGILPVLKVLAVGPGYHRSLLGSQLQSKKG